RQTLYFIFTILQSPMLLINSRYPRFSATTLSSRRKVLHLPVAHLLPKLRCQFAEFLNQSSLNALVFSTCLPVSVYGTGNPWTPVRDFSWKRCIDPLTCGLLPNKEQTSSSPLGLIIRAFVDMTSSYPENLRG